MPPKRKSSTPTTPKPIPKPKPTNLFSFNYFVRASQQQQPQPAEVSKKPKLEAGGQGNGKGKEREVVVIESDEEEAEVENGLVGLAEGAVKVEGHAEGMLGLPVKQEQAEVDTKPELDDTPEQPLFFYDDDDDENDEPGPSTRRCSGAGTGEDDLALLGPGWDDGPPTEAEEEDEEGGPKCPICGEGLLGLSEIKAQQHVNACLDSPASTTAPSPSTIPKPKPAPSRSASPSRPISTWAPRPPSPSRAASPAKPAGPSAFAVLMQGHEEGRAQKAATESEAQRGRVKAGLDGEGRRKAPFYKVMTGMPVAVDAFKYGKIPGVNAYLLSHAHSDHYTSLSKTWKAGPIYCSEITASLIKHMLNVDSAWIHALPMDTPTELPDTGGVCVTLVDANHCPGSAIFVIEGQQTCYAGDGGFKSPYVGSSRTFRYLHCGDFRANPKHATHPAVQGKKFDAIYLDTTYLNPTYCFPSQPLVVSACADLIRQRLTEDADPSASREGESGVKSWLKGLLPSADAEAGSSAAGGEDGAEDRAKQKERKPVLIVVGTYTIGKERILKAIAHALSSKIYADPRRRALLACLADAELNALLTSDPLAAQVHIQPLGGVTVDKMGQYLAQFKGAFGSVVGFRPTGWSFKGDAGMDSLPSVDHVLKRDAKRSYSAASLYPVRGSSLTVTVYGVPYSEHSSFFELTCFALSLNWTKMIATVNVGSEASRAKMARWFDHWAAERKRREKAGLVGCVEARGQDYW